MKSDRPTAAIVAALRARGCDVVYVSSDTEKGVPDLVVATPGRGWTWLEVKDPDGAGDCGCTHTLLSACMRPGLHGSLVCTCSGHRRGNSMRKTRHSQLLWAARHPLMRVVVVHTVEEALRACGLVMTEPFYFVGDIHPYPRDFSLPDLGIRYEVVMGDRNGQRYVCSAVDLEQLADAMFDVVEEVTRGAL